MSRVIRISESIFQRLQKLAVPLVDTPASVIEKLLDYYDSHQNDAGVLPIKSDSNLDSKSPNLLINSGFANDLSSRLPRQRGVVVEVEGRTFKAESVADLYSQILKFICDNGYIEKLKSHLPLRTSSKRYLISTKPIHPSGREFWVPVEYKGYYMEAHKDYKNGVNHLREMLERCGLSLKYIG
ncbi:MAG: hypothetical protein LWW94_02390 [Candidatus Desulfofervidaceae bacterium]|nr:hypothetical protein [Candidatus Desulfofervidaceae bacterium]